MLSMVKIVMTFFEIVPFTKVSNFPPNKCLPFTSNKKILLSLSFLSKQVNIEYSSYSR